jgi:hypothetical protein
MTWRICFPFPNSAILMVAMAVVACSTTQPPPAQPGGAVPTAQPAPADWQPTYWENAMRDAKQGRERGDRMAAEQACARGILYVQAQVIRSLYGYAEVLDRQNYGSGVIVRGKAQKLEQARDDQLAARKSGNNTYIGFDPAAELKSYADVLANLKRNNDALLIEALSEAYRYSQEANLRRAQLRQQNKDPAGEC